MENVVSYTIGNCPKETKIWVKHDFQPNKHFPTGKEFNLHNIECNFDPIEGGHHKKFDVQARGNDTIYLTIVTETGKIISDGSPKTANKNMVITHKGEYRDAVDDPKKPWTHA